MATKTMIARRYAKAFSETFEDLSKAEVQAAELEQFSVLVSENNELSNFLTSPGFDVSEKWNVVSDCLVKAGASEELKGFIRVLVEAGRVAALEEVSVEFKQSVYEKLGYADATIDTAFALTDNELSSITETLEKAVGKKLKITTNIQPEMIAGLKVSVDGKTFDGSFGAHVEKMQRTLLQAEA